MAAAFMLLSAGIRVLQSRIPFFGCYLKYIIKTSGGVFLSAMKWQRLILS